MLLCGAYQDKRILKSM